MGYAYAVNITKSPGLFSHPCEAIFYTKFSWPITYFFRILKVSDMNPIDNFLSLVFIIPCSLSFNYSSYT